jgi:hypothetical protein
MICREIRQILFNAEAKIRDMEEELGWFEFGTNQIPQYENCPIEEMKVDIDGIFQEDTLQDVSDAKPKNRFLRFFTKSDLFARPGDNREPAWANGHRGSLFFDAVPVTNNSLAQSVLCDVERTYKFGLDLGRKSFPAICYYFLNSLASSQFVSQAFRALEDPAYKLDSGLCKLVLSRVWWFKINQLVLHVLFWSEFADLTKREHDRLMKDSTGFRGPTIGKILCLLPEAAETVIPRIKKRLMAKKGKTDRPIESTPISRAIENLNHIELCLLRPNTRLSKKEKQQQAECGLMNMFLRALQTAVAIRPSYKKLSQEQSDDLQQQCAALSNLVTRANQVSHTVLKHLSESTSADSYETINRIAATTLFSDTGWR